jgi:hypothetical protein
MMQWLLAWFLLFLMLYILSRTRSGHTIIYYVAWLSVVLLVITHYDMIDSIFKKGFSS